MPVQRQYVAAKIQDTRSIQPATVNVQGAGSVLKKQASDYARMAAETAAGLASVAEDKAVALARAANLSIDSKGMPAVPENVTEEMGSIARNTWDANIYDRTAQLINTAVNNQVSAAGSDNQYNILNFGIDVNAREAELRKNLPPEFESAFQISYNSAVVAEGARIGHRSASQERQAAGDDFESLIENNIETIRNSIHVNSPIVPMLLKDTIDNILGQKQEVVSQEKKRILIDRVRTSVGISRNLEDNDFRNFSSAKLGNYINAILAENNQGDPSITDNLLEYFPQVDFATGDIKTFRGLKQIDWDQARLFANRLQQLRGEASAKEARNARLSTFNANVSAVAAGNAVDNTTNREILNTLVSNQIEWDGELTPAHWLGKTEIKMTDDQRESVLAQAKQTGFMPSSLEQAIKQLDRHKTPEQFKALYKTYKYLKEGEIGEKGNVNDLSDILGPENQAMFQIIDDMVGVGGELSDSVTEASQRMSALDEGQVDWDKNNNVALAEMLTKEQRSLYGVFQSSLDTLVTRFMDPLDMMPDRDFLYTGPQMMGNLTDDIWVKENPKLALREILRQNLFKFEDLTLDDPQVEQAARIMEIHLRTSRKDSWENPIQKSLALTEASMKGRYIRTDFMRTQFSAKAPEKFYKAPDALTFNAVWVNFKNYMKGANKEAMEQLNPAGWLGSVLNAFDTGPNPSSSWVTPELGADEFIARTSDPFSFIANMKINAILNNGGKGQGQNSLPPNTTAKNHPLNPYKRDFFRGGEDYDLVWNKDIAGKPTYKILMTSEEGGDQFLTNPDGTPFILDVREEFEEINRVHEEMRIELARNEMKDAQELLWEKIKKNETLRKIRDANPAGSGRTVNLRGLGG